MQKLRQVLCINFFIALFVVACQQVTSDNGPQPTGEIVITHEIDSVNVIVDEGVSADCVV